MKLFSVFLILLSICIFYGCGRQESQPGYQKPPARERAEEEGGDSVSPITLARLNHTNLHLSNGEVVRFANGVGKVEGGGKAALSSATFGDLSGEGTEDAAVVIISDFGGTGSFVDLAAVIDRDGEPDNISTAAIGDRVEVDSIRIKNQMIELDVVAHQKGDAVCCPTYQETIGYKLRGGKLVLVEGKPDYQYAAPR